MSRIIVSISSQEFFQVLKYAQAIHEGKDEPIPELNNSNIPKIETALNQPFQTFDGIELYKGFNNKAAYLFYLIIDNHVLNNGNKRMACLILSYFCALNRLTFNIPDKVLRKLAKEVASPHDHDIMIEKIKSTIRRYVGPLTRNGFRN